jgi:prepilin-type processing-associated H-X9-DG protein
MFGPGAADDAEANSANHRGQGTNVLAADGSVSFVTRPDVGPNGDNIWTLVEGNSYRHTYIGTEVAASPDDIFLSP